jgi:DNA-binding NtrC family response regulator
VALDRMVARSRVMQEVFERVRQAAASDATVVIVGEPGTGKELTARSMHARSRRAAGPFAIGLEQLALAEGGTLFIDDLAALDGAGQAALTSLAESLSARADSDSSDGSAPPRGVRLIAGSTRDLEELVKEGRLREDLYFRLAVFAIKLPPLRERPEDVPVLAGQLLHELAARYAKPVTTLPAETQRILSAYAWPGNVRELRNVIEQAVLLARTPELDSLLLPQMLHRGPGQREKILKIAIGTAMDQIEREVILRTLEANGGNKTATAEVLGISRRSIYNKLAVYGIASDGRV